MQSLNKSDEQKLLDGVKTAVSLVDNEGMSPNAALKKVAEDFQYSPGFLKAACNAFNNGRQLAQWDANDSVLDKLASFPLANYEELHNEMWGDKQEKVAATNIRGPKFNSYEDDYKKSLLNMDLSTYEKSASDQEVNPIVADEHATIKSAKAHSRFEYAKRDVEECRRAKTAAEDRLNLKIHLVENYFKKFSYDRLSFAEVDNAVSVYYGEPGKALIDHVAASFPKEKRASDHQASWSGFSKPVDRTAEPYTLVADCIKQANDLFKAVDALESANKVLKTTKEAFASFSLAPLNPAGSQPTLTPSLMGDLEGQSPEKEASLRPIMGGVGGAAGFNLAQGLIGDSDQQSSAALEGQIKELNDPEHMNELRKIRAQTVLAQLMGDPDSPLSGYDPEEVLSAYNDVVQLSPRLADQPSALGPLLNKRLIGNTEPFEVKEQLGLEESLKKTQDVDTTSPTEILKNENSIIG